MRRSIVLGLLLSCALPARARAQVIPGIGMTRPDSRTEATAYRSRVHDELTAVLAEWSRLAERQLRALGVEGAQVSFTVDDFDTSGDFAYLASSLALQPTALGGPPSTMEAHAMFVMLRDFRGRWHIRHQSIAFATPLASAASPGHS